MATDKTYLEYILEQLSDLQDITYRKMMGEYIIYYRQKLIGGLYDNRFLLKPVDSVLSIINEISYELPYEGAKPMLLVDDIDDRDHLAELIEAVYNALPDKNANK